MGKSKHNASKKRGGGKEGGKKTKGIRELQSRQTTSISSKILEQTLKQFIFIWKSSK